MTKPSWYSKVDPELVAVVDQLPEIYIGAPGFREASLAGAAKQAETADVSGLTVTDRHVTGPDGYEVPIRVYVPTESTGGKRAAILHMHGGGYVSGGLDTGHARNAQLARELGVVLVSVDYRLSPETRYPAPLEDCYAALQWLGDQASELEVDVERIAVHGISAGGGLAAAVALAARDRPGPKPILQVLLMPVLDDRQQTPSATNFVDTPVWNRANSTYGWQSYLGEDLVETDAVDVLGAPGRATAEDLRGVCRAYISVQELDPLRDEGIVYAQNLLAADVQVELHLTPGTFHASGSMGAHTTVSKRQAAQEVTGIAAVLNGS